MWRGRQQCFRFVHSVASLITFLPHHVCSLLCKDSSSSYHQEVLDLCDAVGYSNVHVHNFHQHEPKFSAFLVWYSPQFSQDPCSCFLVPELNFLYEGAIVVCWSDSFWIFCLPFWLWPLLAGTRSNHYTAKM